MGRSLVLAEKPSAAKSYAEALNCKLNKENGYYENDKYVIANAIGHLFGLKEPQDYDEKLKKWSLETLPIIPTKFEKKLVNGGKQFKIIRQLINDSDIQLIINGGDPGREGELIQREILEAANNKKPVKRLWVSVLTNEEILKGFNNLVPEKDYDNLYESSKVREIVDWLVGFNYSRGYTKKKGKDVTLTIGRCQTPILNKIVERDRERENFKPIPYYEVISEFEGYSGIYIKNKQSKIDDENEAINIKNQVENKIGIITNLDKSIKKTQHPQLFNLTNLQKTLNKKYGFSADKTLNLAQSLYETHKILSYPRTSSRHLGESMISGFPSMLKSLEFGEFANAINKLDKNNLKVTKRFVDDKQLSDHHALVTTINNIEEIYSRLSEDEKLVFNEVAYNFIACFYPDYEYESTILITSVGEYEFRSNGKQEINLGWREIYADAEEEKEEIKLLPELKEGENHKVTNVKIESKQTKKPAAHNENSILGIMEKEGIGTEATRANIIETLIKREYVKRNKKELLSTELGRDLIDAIETPELKSTELTAELEYELEEIAKGNKRSEDVINKTIENLKTNISALKESTGEVIKRNNEIIGKCPICKTGDILEYKNAYGCSNYKSLGCKFIISKDIAEKNIDLNIVKSLISKGKTSLIKGFKHKDGTKFDAILAIKDGKIGFDKAPGLGKCPVCEKGEIITTKFGYGCSNWKEGCKFSISNTIFGTNITATIVKKLLSKKETEVLKFKGDKGDFEAALIISDGKLKFKSKK